MRSERDFLGLPIHSLQVMLREISYCDHNIPCLIPDGIFGEETLEAVMRFQRHRLLRLPADHRSAQVGPGLPRPGLYRPARRLLRPYVPGPVHVPGPLPCAVRH